MTTDRLIEAFQSHGMQIFARIDQAEAARKSGLEMRPMELVLFGNPAAGTPLMVEYPSLAIDLPLKALVWEDAEGVVWVSYNSPEYLQQRHGLPAPPFGPTAALIEAAIRREGQP
ncbi:DUF302 domain-containing protein [Capsulimonas corticalis]|nr:DUF302 domain-containing protein [Capsulimonas corticalis]